MVVKLAFGVVGSAGCLVVGFELDFRVGFDKRQQKGSTAWSISHQVIHCRRTYMEGGETCVWRW